jgi:3-hydroxybutyrate dehydrogenase
MRLKNKVAVITGGTGGIGLGLAKAFVGEGADVVITGRSRERGEKAVADLGGESRVLYVSGNAMDQQHIEDTVDTAVERFGRLDIMVNNSGGITDTVPVAEMPDEVWDDTIKWNLYSAFWGSRRALKYFIPQRSGRIIMISSLEGKHGKGILSPYAAAKHGMHGLTKSLAQEVGPLGITVNAICPGVIVGTELVNLQAQKAADMLGMTMDAFLEIYAQESALKRFVTIEETAALTVLVASDEGSGITGAALSVDGGAAAY